MRHGPARIAPTSPGWARWVPRAGTNRAQPGGVPGVTGAVILAHQGGWDEMLMVLGPIGLMAGLLRLAKRRVEARQLADAAAGSSADDPAGTGTQQGIVSAMDAAPTLTQNPASGSPGADDPG